MGGKGHGIYTLLAGAVYTVLYTVVSRVKRSWISCFCLNSFIVAQNFILKEHNPTREGFTGMSRTSPEFEKQLAGNWLPILRLSLSAPVFLVLVVSSLLLKLLTLPLPKHLFIRWNTRLIIYPIANILFKIAGVRIQVEGHVPRKNQVVVSNHQENYIGCLS